MSCNGESIFLKNEQGEIIDSVVIAYLGDVDGDGDADKDDLSLLCLISNGMYIPDSRAYCAADLDGDSKVSADDAAILRHRIYCK